MIQACRVTDDVVDALRPIGGPDDFAAVGDEDVEGVIWRRALPAPMQEWIDQLPSDRLPSARVVLRAQDAAAAVRQICDAAHTPRNAQRMWLVNDVATIANAFATSVAVSHLRLRFDVVSDNGCQRFHIDAVKARLICTYRGLGTQYGVMRGGDAPERVFTAPTGAPIVLRGTKWAGHPPGALRHRSPPIAGSHTPRLVLVLDPLPGPTSDDPRDTMLV